MNIQALSQEMLAAYESGSAIAASPTTRDPLFDLHTAYAVESEFARLRAECGRVPVGRKIGYANQAAWSALKLETVIWANMYDDTVHYAPEGRTTFQLTGMHAPKIEPEVVVKLKRAPGPAASTPNTILDAIEWVSIGFEIVDCPYANWQFKPPDFVATWGFHSALIVGAPLRIESGEIPTLAANLADFTVRLLRNGEKVDEGAGKNILGSPALCVAEAASAVAKQSAARPLQSGELISTGSLTAAQWIAPGEVWRVEVSGLGAANLEVRFTTGS